MSEPESLEVGTSRPRFNLAALPEIEEIAAPARPSVTPERLAPAPVPEAPPATGATLTSGGELAQIVHELRFDPSETLLRPRTPQAPEPDSGERHPASPQVGEIPSPPPPGNTDRTDTGAPPDARVCGSAVLPLAELTPDIERAETEKPSSGTDSTPSRLVRLVRALGVDAPLPMCGPTPDPAGV